MAFVDNTLLNEQKKKKLAPGETGDSGNLITASAGTGAGAEVSTPQVNEQAPQNQTAATFAKIRDLNKDQANLLATNLSQAVANRNKQKLESSATDVNKAFNTDVQNNTNLLNDDNKQFVSEVIKRPGNLTDLEADRFNKIRSGYQGPTELSSNAVGKFNADKTLAEQEIDSLDSDAGRQVALENFSRQQNRGLLPSAGVTAFNTSLLRSNDVGKIFDDSQSAFRTDASTIGNKLQQDAGAAVENAKAKSQETSKFLDDSFAGADKSFQDKINAQVAARQAAQMQEDADIAAVLEKLKGNQPIGDQVVGTKTAQDFAGDAALLQKLNLTPQQAADLVNAQTKGTLIDPKNYFTKENPNINVNSVVSDEDRQYYNDLQQLFNKNNNFIGSDQEIGGANRFDYNSAKALADVLPDFSNVNDAGVDGAGNKVPGFDQFVRDLAARNANERSENRNSALAGAASGAATGAKIGSAIPVIGTVAGAVIGAVVGFLANGGFDVLKNDFQKHTNSISKALGFGEVFGGDTAGTKNYKAYKKADPNIPGRSFSADQYGGTRYNVYKENRNSPAMKALAATFGTGGNFGDKATNIRMQEAITGYVKQSIGELQAEGLLPKDNPTLETIDGQKVFNILIIPRLNKLIEAKTGQKDAIKEGAGVVENFLADQVDYILFHDIVKGNPNQTKQAAPAAKPSAPTSSINPTTIRSGALNENIGRMLNGRMVLQ